MKTNDQQKRRYGEGTIFYNETSHRWVAKCIMGRKANGKPDVRSKYCKTETDAKRALRELLLEKHRHNYVEVQRGTVQEFMMDWLLSVKKLKLKEKSFDRLEQTLIHNVFPEIGHRPVAAIETADVQQMLANLYNNGLSYSSIKKAYEAVRACFRWGLSQRPPKVKFNPTDGVEMLNKKIRPPKELQFYTAEEAAQISTTALKTYSNGTRVYRLGAAVVLAINTGLRLGELVGLEWRRDIDFRNRVITVHNIMIRVRDRSQDATTKYITKSQDSTKTDSGQNRTIRLNEDAILALLDLKKVTGETPYVLATKNGNRSAERVVDQMIRRIEEAAGLPENKIYGPHALRHTFATLLFYNGVDIKVISKLLGHSDVSVTYNTYIHVIKEVEINALDMLPRLTAPTKKDH